MTHNDDDQHPATALVPVRRLEPADPVQADRQDIARLLARVEPRFAKPIPLAYDFEHPLR